MFTDFLIADLEDLGRLRTEVNVLEHMEKLQPMVGGIYSRDRIDYLSNVFLGTEHGSLVTGETLLDGSEFFQLAPELVRQIADASHDELLDASVPWDEGAWKDADVNRMDLAGFLLDIGGLCRSAVAAGKNVYFVIVENT